MYYDHNSDYAPSGEECAYCGVLLPVNPREGSLADEGFCSYSCRSRYLERIAHREKSDSFPPGDIS